MQLNKIVVVLMCIPFLSRSVANTLASTEATLFNYDITRNDLPYGDYRCIRSHEKVTQLLKSHGWDSITLYTDRDNSKPSDIFSSSVTRYNSIRIQKKEMRQSEFDEEVAILFEYGNLDNNCTLQFPGLIHFFEAATEGAFIPQKHGSRITVGIQWKNKDAILNKATLMIDAIRKECTIKVTGMHGITKEKTRFYPVIIRDIYSPKLFELLKDYYYRFYDIIKKSPEGEGA